MTRICTTLALATLATLGLAVAHPQAAQAQNLVTNGDFETGDFTGWGETGGTVDAGAGIGGSYAASFGAINPDIDSLYQELAVTPGQQYILTFYAQTPEYAGTSDASGTAGRRSAFAPLDSASALSGQPNSLLVTFGGSPVTAVDVPDTTGFNKYTYMVTANATNDYLAFFISNDPDYTQIDGVSVTPAPEPSQIAGLALGALGLGALALKARRRLA